MDSEPSSRAPTHQPKLPSGIPLIRVIAMPGDANPNGDIFGGWLLSQMDLAGGSLAVQRAKGRCATVAVDGMVFHEPVFVGDEVSCYGELVKTGRTSMTVRIEAWRRHLPSEGARKVTEAIFTYVAIGENRRPRPLPPVGNTITGDAAGSTSSPARKARHRNPSHLGSNRQPGPSGRSSTSRASIGGKSKGSRNSEASAPVRVMPGVCVSPAFPPQPLKRARQEAPSPLSDPVCQSLQ